jgi:hypothetical protein
MKDDKRIEYSGFERQVYGQINQRQGCPMFIREPSGML